MIVEPLSGALIVESGSDGVVLEARLGVATIASLT